MERSFTYSSVTARAVLNGGIRYAAMAEHLSEDKWIEMALATVLLPDDPHAQGYMEAIYSGTSTVQDTLRDIFEVHYAAPAYQRILPRLISLAYRQCNQYAYLLPDREYVQASVLDHVQELIGHLTQICKGTEYQTDGLFDVIAVLQEGLLVSDGTLTLSLVRDVYTVILNYYNVMQQFQRIYPLLSLLVSVHSFFEDAGSVMELREIFEDIEDMEL